MMTSVCSLPMYAATSLAYLRSMASTSMLMAKVRTFLPSKSRAEMAHTSELSSPPLSRKPNGVSESSRFSTPAIRRVRMPAQISSSGPVMYESARQSLEQRTNSPLA